MEEGTTALSRPQVTMDSDSVPNSKHLTTQPKNPQKTFVEVAATDIGPSFQLIRPAEDSEYFDTDGFPAHSKPNLEEIIQSPI